MIAEQMMKKSRLLFLLASCCVVVLIIAGSLIGQSKANRDKAYSTLKIFTHSLRLVDRHYVDDVELDHAMEGAYRGMVERLDPFSSWVDGPDLEALKGRAAQPGVGLTLVKGSNGFIRVASVRYDSPAWEAGIRPGRWIERVEDAAVKEISLLEAHLLLRGPEGTKATLGFFEEDGDEERRVVMIPRRADEAHLVIHDVDAEAHPHTAHVRLQDLEPGAAEALGEHLATLEKEGVTKLVLDLRTNAGGDLDEMIAVADLFLDEGEMLQVHRRRKDKPRTWSASEGRAYTGQVAVLVAPSTIGEAEALAAALKENERAQLVGTRTLGKAFQQEMIPFPDGSVVHLSVAEYRGPGGLEFQGEGVKPNFQVATSQDEEKDDVLDEALRQLENPDAAEPEVAEAA